MNNGEPGNDPGTTNNPNARGKEEFGSGNYKRNDTAGMMNARPEEGLQEDTQNLGSVIQRSD